MSDQTGLVTKERVEAVEPSLYKVLLLNDDFTPMDFVIEVLETFFSKSHAEATEVMLNVHKKGQGVCGIYPLEIAETKSVSVVEYARQNEFPLQCTFERV